MKNGNGRVDLKIVDRIAIITFGHPSHNSLPSDLLRQLTNQIEEAGQDNSVAAIMIQSEGDRTFCAGANFSELASLNDRVASHQFFLGFAKVINAIRTVEKFVVCRVQGKAVGGGVGIIAAADYSLSTKWGSVRLSELEIGIGPFVIGPAVERKIGCAAFSQMAMNAGEWQTAEWAESHGLYQELFDKVEQMDNYLERFLDRLRTYSPDAMRALKKVFWEGTDHWPSLLDERAMKSGELLLTDHTQKVIRKLATS